MFWWFIFQAKKVFVVKGGYKTIRNALRERGWVEAEYYLKKSNEQSTKGNRVEHESIRTDHEYDNMDDLGDSEDSDSEDERNDEEEYVMLVC